VTCAFSLLVVVYDGCGGKTIVTATNKREMSKLLTVRYRTDIESREQPLYTIPEAAEYLGLP